MEFNKRIELLDRIIGKSANPITGDRYNVEIRKHLSELHDLVYKGRKPAEVGDIRDWVSGKVIKTPQGWKPYKEGDEEEYDKEEVEIDGNGSEQGIMEFQTEADELVEDMDIDNIEDIDDIDFDEENMSDEEVVDVYNQFVNEETSGEDEFVDPIENAVGELEDAGIDTSGMDDEQISLEYETLVHNRSLSDGASDSKEGDQSITEEKLRRFIGDDYVAEGSPYLSMSDDQVANLLDENGGADVIIDQLSDELGVGIEEFDDFSDHELVELGSALGFISDSSVASR